jgi:hypothetical protein
MFSNVLRSFLLLLAVVVAGCGAPERDVVEAQPLAPLTRVEWHAMEDLTLKYDPQSFERLQLGDPSLKSDAAWNKFFKDVVVKERAKDFPAAAP